MFSASSGSSGKELVIKNIRPGFSGPILRVLQISEPEVQSKLHLPHGGRGGDCSRSFLIHGRIRVGEVYVVGCVESIPLKFQALPFRDREGFSERQVEILPSRTTQRVTRNETISAKSGSDERR